MSHKNKCQIFFQSNMCSVWDDVMDELFGVFLRQRSHSWHSVKNLTLASLHVQISSFETTVSVNLYLGSTLKSLRWQLSHESFSSWIMPISWCPCLSAWRFSADRRAHPSACPVQLVCRTSLHCFSDSHALPSACPIWSVYRISLSYSSDWCLRHLRFLPADLRLFSSSQDVDTAFAAAVIALALVTTMIQPESLLMQRTEECRENVCPRDFAMLIWCEYFWGAKHRGESLCVDVHQAKE